MILWFGNDRPDYLEAIYKTETMKADLFKLKVELKRLIERQEMSNSQYNILDNNLQFLKRTGKIVSMKTYLKLKHMRASELEVIIDCGRNIPTLEKQIRQLERSIEQLQRTAPTLKFKLLEFKKRE